MVAACDCTRAANSAVLKLATSVVFDDCVKAARRMFHSLSQLMDVVLLTAEVLF